MKSTDLFVQSVHDVLMKNSEQSQSMIQLGEMIFRITSQPDAWHIAMDKNKKGETDDQVCIDPTMPLRNAFRCIQ